jgi:hypothetical protein
LIGCRSNFATDSCPETISLCVIGILSLVWDFIELGIAKLGCVTRKELPSADTNVTLSDIGQPLLNVIGNNLGMNLLPPGQVLLPEQSGIAMSQNSVQCIPVQNEPSHANTFINVSTDLRYKSKNYADEAVSVVSLTSSSGGYINEICAAIYQLLLHMVFTFLIMYQFLPIKNLQNEPLIKSRTTYSPTSKRGKQYVAFIHKIKQMNIT